MAIRTRERSKAPPKGRVGLDAAEDVRTYVVYDDDDELQQVVPYAELQKAVVGFLGRTFPLPDVLAVNGGLGSIRRQLPACDPVFPSLFAEDVEVSVEADEGLEAAANADPDLAVEPVQGHCDYRGYSLAVRYLSRPYNVFPDARLVPQTLEFDGVDVGERWRLRYFKEWLRFVQVSTKATDTRVSAQQGSAMKFRAPGVVAPIKVDGAPYTGIPDMVVPDTLLTLTWFGVPARYVEHDDSFLVRFRGFVNQLDWFNWKKAALLYLNVDVLRTYVQPSFKGAAFVADGVNSDVADAELAGTFANERYCDLALHFILTKRKSPIVYDATVAPNPNWIPAGHNLMPHFPTRKFYYATTAPFGAADATKWLPSYFSVPFELLFQDPTIAANLVQLS